MSPRVDAVLMMLPPSPSRRWGSAAAGPEDRREVGRDREVPVVFGALDEAAGHLHRGVVVEDVETAVALHRRGDHRVDVGAHGDVGVDGDPLGALLLEHANGVGRTCVVHVGDDDAGPVRSEEQRRRLSLTRRGAGDERHLDRPGAQRSRGPPR